MTRFSCVHLQQQYAHALVAPRRTVVHTAGDLTAGRRAVHIEAHLKNIGVKLPKAIVPPQGEHTLIQESLGGQGQSLTIRMT